MAQAIDIKKLRGRDLLELEQLQADESLSGVARTFKMYALLTKTEYEAVLDMPFVEIKEALDAYLVDMEGMTKPKNLVSSEQS